MKRKTSPHKQTFLGWASGISGSLSFLGGWQVCHNLCLGIIAVLSLIGITIVGMPLLFLTQYAVYFWSIAALFLIPTLLMYRNNRRCISPKLLLFNAGIVIASVPFAFAQPYQFALWIAGGVLIAMSIVFIITDARAARRVRARAGAAGRSFK